MYKRQDTANDTLDVSDLLVGFEDGDDISEWVSAAADGAGDTVLTIDADGAGAATETVSLTLQGVGFTAGIDDDFLESGVITV